MTLVNELLTGGDPLASLAEVQAARRALDAAECELIEVARERGIGWNAIASALGVRSRQAAEQRWLRLRNQRGDVGRDAVRAREKLRMQRNVDAVAGEGIVRLRAAVAAAHRRVTGPELLKQTLAAALEAPPGALYDLARRAVDDAGPEDEATSLVREALNNLG